MARGTLRRSTWVGWRSRARPTPAALLRGFTLGHLNLALEQMQRRAVCLAVVGEVTLDFDSSYRSSRSTLREGVDRTYKTGYALHPLLRPHEPRFTLIRDARPEAEPRIAERVESALRCSRHDPR